MAVIVEIQRQKPIDEGEYYAVLRDVQELQGKYGTVLKFWFDIVESGYETSVSGLCSKIASPRSKLFRWLVALGADLSQADTFDVTALKGAPAIVVVSTVTTPSGEEYVNVVDVKPAKMRRVAGTGVAGTNVAGTGVTGTSTGPETSVVNPVQRFVSPQPNPVPNPVQTVQQQQQSAPRPNPNPGLNLQGKKNPFIEEISNLDELEF
jgi:hypothetical protein